MRFLDRGFLLRFLLLVLLYSLVPFGECFLLLTLNEHMNTYLMLSLVAGISLVGLLLVIRPLTRTVRSLQESIDDGRYPAGPFAMLAGTLVAGVLLVTPGFAGDLIGFVLLIPFFRRLVGRIITGRMHDRLKELYEYIKLYER